MQSRFLLALGLLALAALGTQVFGAQVVAQRETPTADTTTTQGILGPGAYIYQTRLDSASCEPDSTSGFVTSYYATIDGVPAARSMRMSLLNSAHWPSWSITVREDGTIVGHADQEDSRGVRMGASHFEVRVDGSRFTGRGYREYTQRVGSENRRCRNSYDALLRRIDIEMTPPRGRGR